MEDETIREDRVRKALDERGQSMRIAYGSRLTTAGKRYVVLDGTTGLVVPGGESLTLEEVEEFAGLRVAA